MFRDPFIQLGLCPTVRYLRVRMGGRQKIGRDGVVMADLANKRKNIALLRLRKPTSHARLPPILEVRHHRVVAVLADVDLDLLGIGYPAMYTSRSLQQLMEVGLGLIEIVYLAGQNVMG
jgi:hypothetical protein